MKKRGPQRFEIPFIFPGFPWEYEWKTTTKTPAGHNLRLMKEEDWMIHLVVEALLGSEAPSLKLRPFIGKILQSDMVDFPTFHDTGGTPQG